MRGELKTEAEFTLAQGRTLNQKLHIICLPLKYKLVSHPISLGSNVFVACDSVSASLMESLRLRTCRLGQWGVHTLKAHI